MCTMSWLWTEDGYALFFNRDEKHTRLPEAPPVVEERRGARVAAPRDGDAGGTWLALNDRGLSVGLLNSYVDSVGPAPSPDERRSRGLLVLDLADSPGLDELAERLDGLSLAPYPPFRLVALAPEGMRLWDWNGLECAEEPDPERRCPLISSSFDQSVARSRRKAWFEELEGDRGRRNAQMLEEFHHSHVGGPGPFSPCMHRDDAQTRSFVRIEVDAGEAVMDYRPGPPCERAPLQRVALRRAPEGARLG